MFEDLKQIHKEKEAKIVAEERHIETLRGQKVVSDTILESASSIIRYLEGRISRTEVLNQIEGFATTEDMISIASLLTKLDETIQSTKPNEKVIVEAINSLKQETASLPSKIKIEKTENVKVDNLDEIKPDNSDIVKAIEDKKLEVNVEAPIINTEKADFSVIEKILTDLLNKPELKIPDKFKISNLNEIKPTDTKEIEKKLEKGNKFLKEISEKNFGGSSGSGRVSPYEDSNGMPSFVTLVNGKVPVDVDMATEGIATEATLAKTVGFDKNADITITKTVVGNVTTFVKTDGVRTQTITIDKDTNVTTKVWS